MALTGKKKLFAKARLDGKSNKDAAIAAGYSPATASQAGSRLARDDEMAAYLAKHMPKGQAVSAPALPEPEGDTALQFRHDDPKEFLKASMNDLLLDPKLRIDAAKALLPIEHARKGEAGKKDAAKDAAKAAAGGKFGPRQPPRLVANNG